ncbi:GerAB/ArcD/ProY family transporter [Paenibacillus arenilitoris]|uniref:Endospore germination permease n=1 Tax=Paenibacillus arenilitoris TaxID=2772299 RepID=A0A927H6E9_9BACL|nr:endospore germination permease [Paenibacillus arenilitoris]MBD2870481.1 endospore germination permease [Paenibacillus arenilitoris]
MERISLNQLGSLIVIFLIGSSPLFLLAIEAGKDAWLAVFVGMLCGLALLWGVNLAIYRYEPDMHLFEIMMKYLGKPAGYLLSVCYVFYFCYKSIRNVREFGDLSIIYLLPTTPLSAVMALICLTAGLSIVGGAAVFFRMAEFTIPVVIGIYALLFLLMAGTGLFNLDYIIPVFDEGLKPIWDAAFPETVSFPFGELVLFLMFWKLTDADRNAVTAIAVKCYLFSGLFITLTNLLIVAGMGKLAPAVTVPLMQLASSIEAARVLERIDPLVALLLFTGVMFKLTSYYLGAVIGIRYLTKLSHKTAVLIAGGIIYGGSFLFRSYMEHIWFGFVYNVKYHFPLFQIVFPIVLVMIVAFKNRRAGKEDA